MTDPQPPIFQPFDPNADVEYSDRILSHWFPPGTASASGLPRGARRHCGTMLRVVSPVARFALTINNVTNPRLWEPALLKVFK